VTLNDASLIRNALRAPTFYKYFAFNQVPMLAYGFRQRPVSCYGFG